MNSRIAAISFALLLGAAACGDRSEAVTIAPEADSATDQGVAASDGDNTVAGDDDTVSIQNNGGEDSPSLGVPVNISDFDGLAKDEAITKAESENREWRIGSEDGEDFELTEDFHVGRVTFDILEGVVVFSFIEMEPNDFEMVVEPEGPSGEDIPDFALALIDLPKDEAIAAIDNAGFSWRISSEDGEDFALTMDYLEERVNLTILDGIVVEVAIG